jgi:hypothetical protein
MGRFTRHEFKDVPFGSDKLATDKAGRGQSRILIVLSGKRNELCRADTPLCYRRWADARGRASCPSYAPVFV